MSKILSLIGNKIPEKWDRRYFRLVPQPRVSSTASISKAKIESVLTGEITSHTHPGGEMGSGDMVASTYDPTSVEGDAFDMDNMVEGDDTKILTAAERSLIASALQSAPANPMIILTKSSSVNQNVGGANNTEVWWTWDGEDKKDTGFTHSTSTNSGRVQVGADGWYQIRFIGNVEQTGGSRTTLQGIIRVNGGTTQRKGSIRDYSRGSGYGNLSPGLDCIMYLTSGDYIEVGTRVEDTDSTYTLSTNGSEIDDDENLLYITKIG